jgi:SAM-dependent methyltransferase
MTVGRDSRVPASGDADTIAEMMRFVVPLDASVAVLGGDGDDAELFAAWRKLRPLEDHEAMATQELVARLRELRAEGCEYLVVRPASLARVDAEHELRSFLEESSRLVAREEPAGAVFALREPAGAPRDAPDGLPFPPTGLIRITSGCVRQAMNNPERLFESYWESGARGAEWIAQLLQRNGFPIDDRASILDFGCGCGRIIRHWRRLETASLHGCDYNPNLVSWCSEALPFAEFSRNDLEPGLPYEAGQFDLVYSISIFTHLDEPLQVPWMRELARVVRPGGLLLITVMGEDRLRSLPAWERLREPFEAGELVVTKPERAGSNACAVYHPLDYVRDTLTAGLEIVDYEAGSPAAVRQDGVLLRTPVK